MINIDDEKNTLVDGIKGKLDADATLEKLRHSAFVEQAPELAA